MVYLLTMHPLPGYIIIKPRIEDASRGGIIIKKDSPNYYTKGEVIAVGEAKRKDGELIAPHVRVGDLVIYTGSEYQEYHGNHIVQFENIVAHAEH